MENVSKLILLLIACCQKYLGEAVEEVAAETTTAPAAATGKGKGKAKETKTEEAPAPKVITLEEFLTKCKDYIKDGGEAATKLQTQCAKYKVDTLKKVPADKFAAFLEELTGESAAPAAGGLFD